MPELNSHISATWNISTRDLQKESKGVGILRQKVASRSEELHTLITFVSLILDSSEDCLPILRETDFTQTLQSSHLKALGSSAH